MRKTAYALRGVALGNVPFEEIVEVDTNILAKDVINYLEKKNNWKIAVCRFAFPFEVERYFAFHTRQ